MGLKFPFYEIVDSPNNRAVAMLITPAGFRSRPIKSSVQRELVDDFFRGHPAPDVQDVYPAIVTHVRFEVSGLRRAIIRRICEIRGLRERPRSEVPFASTGGEWEPRRYANGEWFLTNDAYWERYPEGHQG